ncbi:cyclin-dependent protein kinase inhibitor SMR15-like [Impatiens glandulifera]|uniref:cyclin-dependent protein kinase inhibitor SMR15-like n=1 Tax=Impatiens glandulifera TaxID=253017 RepID=UPI001FB0DAE7|nr:cyclin-dependent protein kinase inhibitor SMR15-like [Impatiens glandulifera]
MGYNNNSDETHVELGGVESWVIAGIPFKSSLKPVVFTSPATDNNKEEESPTTPTSEASRIPSQLPPPPRKPKTAPLKRSYNGGGGGRVFFNPPDLETVFIRRVHI